MSLRIRRRTCCLILAACIQTGCGKNETSETLTEDPPVIEDEGRETNARARASIFPLQLSIATEGPQTRDRLSIRAKVKNISDKPCGWDSKFAVYCGWWVSIGNQAMGKPTVLESIESEKSCSRFISLAPGQSASRLFVLTRPFRRFEVLSETIPGTKDGRDVGAVENAVKFVIPTTAKGVEVRWVYYSSPFPEVFHGYFGFKDKEVLMSAGIEHSNVLEISFND